MTCILCVEEPATTTLSGVGRLSGIMSNLDQMNSFTLHPHTNPGHYPLQAASFEAPPLAEYTTIGQYVGQATGAQFTTVHPMQTTGQYFQTMCNPGATTTGGTLFEVHAGGLSNVANVMLLQRPYGVDTLAAGGVSYPVEEHQMKPLGPTQTHIQPPSPSGNTSDSRPDSPRPPPRICKPCVVCSDKSSGYVFLFSREGFSCI